MPDRQTKTITVRISYDLKVLIRRCARLDESDPEWVRNAIRERVAARYAARMGISKERAVARKADRGPAEERITVRISADLERRMRREMGRSESAAAFVRGAIRERVARIDDPSRRLTERERRELAELREWEGPEVRRNLERAGLRGKTDWEDLRHLRAGKRLNDRITGANASPAAQRRLRPRAARQARRALSDQSTSRCR